MSLIALVTKRNHVVSQLLTSHLVSAQQPTRNNQARKLHTQGSSGKMQRSSQDGRHFQYCYNLSVLVDDFLDPQLARFDLDESTGDKVHHFIFRKHHTTGKVIMQYKLLRYSVALYPRKCICPATHFFPTRS
jgi:hypothetical protein